MILLLTLESHSTKVSQKRQKSHSTKGQNYMTFGAVWSPFPKHSVQCLNTEH